jgi:hypothetical protein
MRESQQQTQLLGSVVLLHLKCSYLVLSLKASAKVQQFSEPPKLFRSFFLKIIEIVYSKSSLTIPHLIIILLHKLNIPFSLNKENEKHKMKDPKAGFSRPNEHFYDNVLR